MILIAMWALVVPMAVFAQTTRISGTVVDQLGEAIIGANVQVEGTSVGSITDIDGKFAFEAPRQGTLVISYIGYKTQKMPLGNTNTFRIILIEDAETLEEVVVVGYGVQKKATLTGAVSQIQGDEVLKGRATSNVGTALQGAIPGLTITRKSARPTENATITLRGGISVNDGIDPLILIDGVDAYSWELNQINPNDIESVSVLKDAAASIYGARAAGGVILITTKRGEKNQKLQITYNGSVNFNYKGKEYPAATGSEWAKMMMNAAFEDEKYGGTSSLWAILGFTEAEYQRVANNEAFSWENGGKTYRIDPLNGYQPDLVYGTTTGTSQNISIKGGNDKLSALTSIGYSKDRSLVKLTFDGQEKYNVRSNIDYKFNNYVSISTNISYDHVKKDTPTYGIGYGMQDFYIFPLYTESGKFYDNFGQNNIAAHLVEGGKTKDVNNMLRVGGSLNVDLGFLTKGLSANLKGNIRQYNGNKRSRSHSITLYNWDDTVYATSGSKANLESMTERYTRSLYQSYEFFLNYDRTFGKHHVAAMIGNTNELRNNYQLSAYRSGLNYTSLDDLATGDTTTDKIYNTDDWPTGSYKWSFVSFLGRLNYDYEGKYLVEFSARRDGSSKLAKDQRWDNFFGVSGGWRLSEEAFIKDNIDWLSNLKIRASWGQSGGLSGIGNYDSYAAISTGTTIFGTTPDMASTGWISGMTDASRSWERVESMNYGIDFGVLNNRLTGSFDYFKRKNKGMLISITYPATLGGTAPSTNSGNFTAKGWELVLNWQDRINKDWSYNIGFTLDDSETKVTKYTGNTTIAAGSNKIVEGKPLNSLYVYRTDGMFQTEAEVDVYLAQMNGAKSGSLISGVNSGSSKLRPGSVRRLDLNGDNDITTDDLDYYGDLSPHYRIGLNLGVQYKGIDFSAFFQGVGKQNTIRKGQMLCAFYSGWTNTNGYLHGKTWSSEDNPVVGGNSNADFPIMSRNGTINNWNYKHYNDINVMNTWYLRAKSISLGYTLPNKITRKAAIEKMRVWVAGENLFDISNIKDGFDPESYSEMETYKGVEIYSSTISFGIDLTF